MPKECSNDSMEFPVSSPAELPRLGLHPERLTLYEKEKYELVFETEESVSGPVKWLKDGLPIRTRRIKDTDNFTQTLVIENVECIDSGEYKVEGPNFRLTAILAVKPLISPGKPAFVEEPPAVVTKFEDEECNLIYKFSEKLSEVNFYKGEKLCENRRIQTTDSPSGEWNLRIRGLKKSDSGSYHAQCQHIPSRATKLVVKTKEQTSRKRRHDREYLGDRYLKVLARAITEEEKQDLGPELGFSRGEMSCFKKDNDGNLRQEIFSMLTTWRNKQESDGETQVKSLAKILARVGRVDLKKRLLKENKLA